jgi:predicted Zn-dependent protease
VIRGAAIYGIVALAAWAGGPACADMSADDQTMTPPVPIESLKPAERPSLSTDEAGVWLMADRLEASLKTSGNLVRDPAVNGYVRGIVCKLAGPHCPDIRVYVVRRAGFNAGMLPNGAMSVWTGLLARVSNEAQLAAVLSHEIAHYLRRHSIQAQRDARNTAGAAMFFSIAFGVVGIPAGPFIQMAALGSIHSFSRDNEREADALGARLMADAGYDVREAAALWQNLRDERKDDETEESRSIFFATHPEPEERQQTLSALVETLNPPNPRLGIDEMRAVTAPLRLTYLRDELNQGRHTKFGNLLNRLEKDQLNPQEIYYMRGEMLRVRGKGDDNEKAIESYRKALELGGVPAELHRSLGLVEARLDRKAEARAGFAKYLELKADADDGDMIRMMMQQLEINR